jgi:hypothetical protein
MVKLYCELCVGVPEQAAARGAQHRPEPRLKIMTQSFHRVPNFTTSEGRAARRGPPFLFHFFIFRGRQAEFVTLPPPSAESFPIHTHLKVPRENLICCKHVVEDQEVNYHIDQGRRHSERRQAA